MKTRIAFAGFRHSHMLQFYALAGRHREIEIAAAAEDDPAAAAAAAGQGVRLTHSSVDALLADSSRYDVLAIGETYGRRGALALRALEAGRHLVIDKPPCTRLDELERIAAAARAKSLRVGCLLDLRDSGPIRALRREVRAGTIGRVHSVVFMGQHPLMFGRRPGWYFEPGQHGGTLNDIAIHALDVLPWLLGSPVAEIVGARAWNDRLREHPDFEIGAQDLHHASVGRTAARARPPAGGLRDPPSQRRLDRLDLQASTLRVQNSHDPYLLTGILFRRQLVTERVELLPVEQRVLGAAAGLHAGSDAPGIHPRRGSANRVGDDAGERAAIDRREHGLRAA